jgi:hypothetical protein
MSAFEREPSSIGALCCEFVLCLGNRVRRTFGHKAVVAPEQVDGQASLRQPVADDVERVLVFVRNRPLGHDTVALLLQIATQRLTLLAHVGCRLGQVHSHRWRRRTSSCSTCRRGTGRPAAVAGGRPGRSRRVERRAAVCGWRLRRSRSRLGRGNGLTGRRRLLHRVGHERCELLVFFERL